jgi:hypothetical protein
MTIQRWEYCLLASTPLSGLDDDGIRVSYQLSGPSGTERVVLQSDNPSPLGAVAELLNRLGDEGWELVAYDTTTNRGIFKRPKQ